MADLDRLGQFISETDGDPVRDLSETLLAGLTCGTFGPRRFDSNGEPAFAIRHRFETSCLTTVSASNGSFNGYFGIERDRRLIDLVTARLLQNHKGLSEDTLHSG